MDARGNYYKNIYTSSPQINSHKMAILKQITVLYLSYNQCSDTFNVINISH